MRYFKVALSSVALFMVFMWISVMLNSCNNNKNTELQVEEFMDEDLGGSDYTDEFESEFESEGEALEDEVTSTSEDAYENTGDYTTVSKTFPVAAEKPKATNTSSNSSSTTTSKTPSYSTSGDYLVVAGSYLIKDNAQQMAKKLNNKGYQAEIVNFDYSQYHSILAGRYSTRSIAKKTAQNLKNMGIDAYVHKRQ